MARQEAQDLEDGLKACALAGAPVLRPRAAPRFAPASMKLDMPGECPPLGFFDPLGFSKNASPETMKKYREAELKHGRVAMLAALGMITADKWHPLFGGKNSANPLLALTQTPKLGWLQILTFIMFIEVLGILNSRRPDYQPGDFLGSSQWETDEGWQSYQTKELNNGRLAMFGSIGMLVGSYITGKGPLEVMDAGDTIVF
jgi:hypothetical protein